MKLVQGRHDRNLFWLSLGSSLKIHWSFPPRGPALGFKTHRKLLLKLRFPWFGGDLRDHPFAQ